MSVELMTVNRTTVCVQLGHERPGLGIVTFHLTDWIPVELLDVVMLKLNAVLGIEELSDVFVRAANHVRLPFVGCVVAVTLV